MWVWTIPYSTFQNDNKWRLFIRVLRCWAQQTAWHHSPFRGFGWTSAIAGCPWMYDRSLVRGLVNCSAVILIMESSSTEVPLHEWLLLWFSLFLQHFQHQWFNPIQQVWHWQQQRWCQQHDTDATIGIEAFSDKMLGVLTQSIQWRCRFGNCHFCISRFPGLMPL